MMNHVNSMKRKSLRGKSPYEVAKLILPEDFFPASLQRRVMAEEFIVPYGSRTVRHIFYFADNCPIHVCHKLHGKR